MTKSSEILRKAAKGIELDRGWNVGCYAIGCVAQGQAERDAAFRHFVMVAPLDLSFYSAPSRTWWDFDDRDSRIIGLCLAAAIAESEGD